MTGKAGMTMQGIKTGSYDDIINLPHHQSMTRERMTIRDRAAQFSPFAALTGHEADIEETSRLTDRKVQLSEDKIAALNEKLQMLEELFPECPEVSITYFVTDEKKSGGAYTTKTGRVKRIDPIKRAVEFADHTAVPFEDVFDVEGTVFHGHDFSV